MAHLLNAPLKISLIVSLSDGVLLFFTGTFLLCSDPSGADYEALLAVVAAGRKCGFILLQQAVIEFCGQELFIFCRHRRENNRPSIIKHGQIADHDRKNKQAHVEWNLFHGAGTFGL
ncbi:MAG: hypothetical protein PHS41_03960 [Victivallaceae bacterium]|nr:hypothetical protein [Victivallaceae bacterium]